MQILSWSHVKYTYSINWKTLIHNLSRHKYLSIYPKYEQQPLSSFFGDSEQ
jgi:hypothetical protein